MFSVVIPLYNKELSIRNTIQSVLDQTCQDFEIVVVNDGSTDNSAAVVEAIEDDRIRLIHQKNQGVSAARNRGIEEARCEWVAFLDADDLWEPDHVAEFRRQIESHPDATWLFSGFLVDNGRKVVEQIFHDEGVLENVFDAILQGAVIHTSTVCVKRALFFTYDALWFTRGLRGSEDREVWYKLSCIDCQPIYIAKPLSTYCINVTGSLTKVNGASLNDDFLTMSDRLADYLSLTTEENSRKLREYLWVFNRKALLQRYVKGSLGNQYRKNFRSAEFLFLSLTMWLPRFVKAGVSKVLVRL